MLAGTELNMFGPSLWRIHCAALHRASFIIFYIEEYINLNLRCYSTSSLCLIYYKPTYSSPLCRRRRTRYSVRSETGFRDAVVAWSFFDK